MQLTPEQALSISKAILPDLTRLSGDKWQILPYPNHDSRIMLASQCGILLAIAGDDSRLCFYGLVHDDTSPSGYQDIKFYRMCDPDTRQEYRADITISANRSPASIAGDLARRLIPNVRAAAALIYAVHDRQSQARAEVNRIREQLFTAMGRRNCHSLSNQP